MSRPALARLLLGAARCLLCLPLCLAADAQAEPPQWSGSIRSLSIYGDDTPASLAPDYRLSSNRARLNVDWQVGANLLWQAALDHQFLWKDPADIVGLPDNGDNRHLDLDKTWAGDRHGASRLQIDRLSLQWRSGAMDVTLGRQAVGFGRILIYSPLDVIAPFAPDAIDTEIRSGVDALRWVFNYGLDGQLGAIAVWGDEPRHNSYLVTWNDNRSGVDLLLMGGRLRGRDMVGAGLAGSLGTLGLKGEFSVYDGREVDEPGGDLHETYALAAVEAWYRFNSGITLIAQYLYNGPGSGDPADYPAALASAPVQEGLTTLLGRHYLMVAPSYELHPLVTLQGLVIYNTEDRSSLFRPALDLNLADNLSLQLFWTWTSGRQPRTPGALLPIEPRSEFGSRGDLGGIFLRWFF